MTRRVALSLLPLVLTALSLFLDPAAARAANPESIDSHTVLRALEDAFVSVADRVTPAVVNVSVKPKRSAPEVESPERQERFREFFGPEFFERFFRRRQPREEPRSSGSGVIVDPQGYILTNNHVVENAGSVEVRLSDDRKFQATIVGRDPKTDLDVLKISAPGGALLNIEGNVIGINTAMVSSGQGIGFSIPINMAREIMAQLMNKGRVVRGWLGIVIQELTPELAESFAVQRDSGVLVADVMKDSPAEAAGLKPGDIIVEFGGAPIKDVTELQKRVAAVEPGQATPLVVIRDKVSTPLTVKIGEQPGEETAASAQPKEETLGLTVEPLTPEASQRFQLTAKSGVVVTDVAPGSSGEQAGIRAGDAILEVNRQPVTDVESFRRIIVSVKPGEIVPVYLQRGGGRNEYVVLSVPDIKR